MVTFQILLVCFSLTFITFFRISRIQRRLVSGQILNMCILKFEQLFRMNFIHTGYLLYYKFRPYNLSKGF